MRPIWAKSSRPGLSICGVTGWGRCMVERQEEFQIRAVEKKTMEENIIGNAECKTEKQLELCMHNTYTPFRRERPPDASPWPVHFRKTCQPVAAAAAAPPPAAVAAAS